MRRVGRDSPGLGAHRASEQVVGPAMLATAAFVAAVLVPADAQAYVGPGAGIAVATTVMVLLISVVAVILGLLSWPIRFVYRLITRKRPPEPPRIKRAVLIGLDGLDPKLVRQFMDEGRLPNMQKLANAGMMSELDTTYPAMSPVAWSTFATGVQPAKHGIYDFLTRDPKSYQPDLSSTDIRPPHRHLTLGKYRLPLGKPQLSLLRKSKAFWEILGRYRVPCSILRVPITFPPTEVYGHLLSAMCVPDLQGSQGTFAYYTSDSVGSDGDGAAIGGQRIKVEVKDGRVDAQLAGPPNPIRTDAEVVQVPFSVRIDAEAETAELRIGRERVSLRPGEFSDWTAVTFKLGLGVKLRGICRFRLLSIKPHFRLYVTPINIDPENPILPISYPRFFSIYLSKLIGRYATLGLAEDTWALNEGVIDEDAFLEQAWANHDEREAMFFEMLKRTPRGLITCVFDGTDRIQHMFMRYLDEDHPALAEHRRAISEAADDHAQAAHDRYKEVIPDTYKRMDDMLGQVLDKVDVSDPSVFLAVLSDHGFQTFRRGINLNSWLHQNGYLALEPGRETSDEWFRGVDWHNTRAFAVGLGGIFLNLKGREAHGVVAPDEADELASEIAGKLTGLRDEAVGEVGIRSAYPAHELYHGPYAEDAPDLVVGYAAGWRASWDGARGLVGTEVFDDNTKAWSGDHCIDPELVPGVLICNQRLATDERRPAIADMAPTMLDMFGIPAPRYMDGQSLVVS